MSEETDIQRIMRVNGCSLGAAAYLVLQERADRADARLASVEHERDEIIAMAGRREDELRSRLAEAEALLTEIAGHRPAVAFFAPQLAGVIAALDRIDAHLAREQKP